MSSELAAPEGTPTSQPLGVETAETTQTNQSDAKAKPSPEQIAHNVLREHDAKLFRPPNKPFNVRDIQLPDSFFEPTTSELTSVYRTYAQRTENLQNATLKTSKMRQAEQEERMKRFRHILIRIQLPDRVVLQGVFQPQSTLRQVRRFIRAALVDARNVKFHLFVVPPKRILSNFDATLWSEGFVPAALIHMGIEDNGPVDSNVLLKQTLLAGITDAPEVASAMTDDSNSANTKTTVLSSAAADGGSKEGTKEAKPARRKIPKWFKK